METLDFHFTLGPVQGFVAQARRTRDFWAGSFLLSWLSGVAMRATEAQGGTIVFPKPPTAGQPAQPGQATPDYLDWIADPPHKANPVDSEWRKFKPTEPLAGPVQGAIPNRFKARVNGEFSGLLVEQAVRDAWQALAEHIWLEDVAIRLSPGQSTLARQVWERQHAAFWEIAWVLANGSEPASALDCRKNWRSHLPPPEPGLKCHLMEGWQELSGVVGITAAENKQRQAFWKALTRHRETDFRDSERLCAIAYVKRRFVRHFDGFTAPITLGENGPTLRLCGWKLPVNQPSTAYMAAVHWLEELLKKASPEQLRDLQEAGRKFYDEDDERHSRIKCLVEAAGNPCPDLISLDGSLFFEDRRQGLLKEFKASLGDRPDEEHRKRQAVQGFGRRLADLAEALGKAIPEQPTPFYAVLLMDGDNLGAHMGKADNQETIPLALDRFTTDAARIVRDHNGSLIYAGGDDVLALLPLEDALACAVGLRAAYLCAFALHKPRNRTHPIPTTLSGAVVFAHVKTPLGEVLRQAHRVLDKVAKDGAGRDALAVRVLKPGGEHLTFAQPWNQALVDGRLRLDGSGPDAPPDSQGGGLVQAFRDAAQGEPGFSSKFFFRARARLALLDEAPAKGKAPVTFKREERTKLLKGDFIEAEPTYPLHLRGTDQKEARRAWLDQLMAQLLDHCTVHVRTFDPDTEVAGDSTQPKLSADALMLVRFLAHKGVEPHA